MWNPQWQNPATWQGNGTVDNQTVNPNQEQAVWQEVDTANTAWLDQAPTTWDQSPSVVAPTETAPVAPTPQPTAPVQQQPTQVEPAKSWEEMVTIPKSSLTQILDRLENLEKETWSWQDTKSKKYDWPLHYSYKLRWDVPVLSYVSKRRDPRKPLRYRNEMWIYVSNHLLSLNLADWKSVDVDVEDFGQHFERSPKQEAEVRKKKDGSIVYVFGHHTYGDIEVLDHVIN